VTPDELRSLADEAGTEWRSRRVASPRQIEAGRWLEDHAPALARLCAELGEALAVGIEDVLLMDSPEGDSPRNIASNLRGALAKLSELEAR